jgi:hypothetical protein
MSGSKGTEYRGDADTARVRIGRRVTSATSRAATLRTAFPRFLSSARLAARWTFLPPPSCWRGKRKNAATSGNSAAVLHVLPKSVDLRNTPLLGHGGYPPSAVRAPDRAYRRTGQRVKENGPRLPQRRRPSFRLPAWVCLPWVHNLPPSHRRPVSQPSRPVCEAAREGPEGPCRILPHKRCLILKLYHYPPPGVCLSSTATVDLLPGTSRSARVSKQEKSPDRGRALPWGGTANNLAQWRSGNALTRQGLGAG